MRIVYFGTPEFAVPALKQLIDTPSVDLVGVVTQPDKPAGRGRHLTPSPIKQLALQHNLNLFQPEKANTRRFRLSMESLKSDLIVVAAYGQILSRQLLESVPLAINIHASILPRWRGAAPIAAAIKNGDENIGVSIMKVVQALDAGPWIIQKYVQLLPSDTCGELTEKMAVLGAEALMLALTQLEKGSGIWHDQDEAKVTYAHKIEPSDAHINWNQEALQVQRDIHAYSPHPGAFSHFKAERVKVYKVRARNDKNSTVPGRVELSKDGLFVSCLHGHIEILELQRPSKPRQSAVSLLGANLFWHGIDLV